MNKIIILIAFLATLSCATKKTMSEDLDTRIKDAISEQIGPNGMVGAIVGVYEKERVRYYAFGSRKKDEKTLIDENTLFEIGSITKTFTSLLFAQAIELKLVTPETTLAEIRPEWKNERLGTIKLMELATHTSGLPRLPCNLKWKDDRYPYADYTEKEFIQSITDKEIQASSCKTSESGKKVSYSNWGTGLLGEALAHRAGLSYSALVKKWITKPLRMNQTVINLRKDQLKDLANGYNFNHEPIGEWNKLALQGSGSIKSSAKDMMIYAKAFLYPESTPIGPALRRTYAQIYTFEGVRIGYNWFFTPGGSIWHDGMSGGYSSFMKIYLKNKEVIFMLANTATPTKCLIEAAEKIECDPKN